MSRAILCLAFVIALASIGNGRVIEKRSPGSDEVRRVGNKVVDVANDVGDTFVDAGNLGKGPFLYCVRVF